MIKVRFREARQLLVYFMIPAGGALAPLFVYPVLTQKFGTEGWAAIAVGQSIGLTLSIIVDLGWGIIGPQSVARVSSRETRVLLLRRSIAARVVILPPGIVLGLLLIYTLVDAYRIEAMIMMVAFALIGLSSSWYFVGENKPHRVLLTDTLPKVTANMMSAILLSLGGALIFFPLLLLALTLLGTASVVSIVGSAVVPGKADWTAVPATIREQWVIALGRIIGSTYTSQPTAFLALVSPAVVPGFAGVDRLVRMALNLLNAVSSRLQSWIALDLADSGFKKRCATAWLVNTAFGGATAVGVFLVLPWLVRLLYSGTITMDASSRIFASLLVMSITVTRSNSLVLIALQRPNHITTGMSVAAILALILLPTMAMPYGVSGALLALCFAELGNILVQGTAIVLLFARIRIGP